MVIIYEYSVHILIPAHFLLNTRYFMVLIRRRAGVGILAALMDWPSLESNASNELFELIL